MSGARRARGSRFWLRHQRATLSPPSSLSALLPTHRGSHTRNANDDHTHTHTRTLTLHHRLSVNAGPAALSCVLCARARRLGTEEEFRLSCPRARGRLTQRRGFSDPLCACAPPLRAPPLASSHAPRQRARIPRRSAAFGGGGGGRRRAWRSHRVARDATRRTPSN